MTRSAISPRLATRTLFNMPQPPSEPHLSRASSYLRGLSRALSSDAGWGYGGGCGDSHERCQGDLDQVERHEDQDALRHRNREGQVRHNREPDGAEGVDHGEPDAPPEEADGQRSTT